MDFLYEPAIGALGLLFLMMFFRAVHTRWPESYFSIKDITSYRISTTPLRYGLFRFGPVVVASFFVGSLAARSDRSSGISVATLLVGHLVLSSGLAIARAVRLPTAEFAKRVRLILYALLSVGVILAGVAGWGLSLSPTFRQIIPSSGDVTFTLWTAGFAGIVGAFLIAISRGETPTTRAVMRRSRSKLSDPLWEYMAAEAERLKADVALVRAVALVENLQRPSWVRALERLKGRVFPRGSYGLMQVTTERPISDNESVTLAIERWFTNTKAEGYVEELDETLSSYNPDQTFRDLGRDFYYELAEQPSYEDEDEVATGDDSSLELSGRKVAGVLGTVAALGAIAGYIAGKRIRSGP